MKILSFRRISKNSPPVHPQETTENCSMSTKNYTKTRKGNGIQKTGSTQIPQIIEQKVPGRRARRNPVPIDWEGTWLQGEMEWGGREETDLLHVLDQVERNCDSCRVRERVLPVPCMW
jgi:hypothetical protein